MPTDIRPLLPSLAVRPTLPTIVVGARLLFDRADIGKERNGRNFIGRCFLPMPKQLNLRVDGTTLIAFKIAVNSRQIDVSSCLGIR